MSSSSLIQAVRINNEIRQVVEASRQVNYVALNALLISRKAGARSLGFAVVARELRTLSRDLEKSMSQLDAVIGDLVTGVASMIGRGRLLDYMGAAAAACAQPPNCMVRTLNGMRRFVEGRQVDVERDWEILSRHFTQALRLSELGGILSRNAKVEAAHGGEMAGALRQVAEQIETSVNQVIGLLRGLRALIRT
jgi:methyl-accepting chemotaxis protein